MPARIDKEVEITQWVATTIEIKSYNGWSARESVSARVNTNWIVTFRSKLRPINNLQTERGINSNWQSLRNRISIQNHVLKRSNSEISTYWIICIKTCLNTCWSSCIKSYLSTYWSSTVKNYRKNSLNTYWSGYLKNSRKNCLSALLSDDIKNSRSTKNTNQIDTHWSCRWKISLYLSLKTRAYLSSHHKGGSYRSLNVSWTSLNTKNSAHIRSNNQRGSHLSIDVCIACINIDSKISQNLGRSPSHRVLVAIKTLAEYDYRVMLRIDVII